MKRVGVKLLLGAFVVLLVGDLFFTSVRSQSVTDGEESIPQSVQASGNDIFSYQGQILDASGNPLTNPALSMTFRLYAALTGGDPCAGWSETQSVNVEDGHFHINVGSVSAIPESCLMKGMYLELAIGGETLIPRELLTSAWHTPESDTLPDGATTRGALNVAGDINLQNHALNEVSTITNGANIIAPASGSAPSVRLISSNGVFVFIDQDNDQTDQKFAIITNSGYWGGDALTLMTVNEDGNLGVRGNVTCGGMVERNLQTDEEASAGRIERFTEGDVLCWGIDQLELCTSANDRLVQAVADPNGRPIVIGAEVIKVIGPVHYGDLLVASDVPGYAMVNNDPRAGAVIAQALEDFVGEQGIIKAMIRKF
jgi:hypothetical protein